MKKPLIVIQLFIAITAIIGGIGLLINGAGMPSYMLQHSPFASFLIPGLLLGLVVGGTHGLAAYLNIKHNPQAQFASAVAGFGMLLWVYGQIYFILATHWLQNFYFALGITELVLVMLMLGIVPLSRRAAKT